MKHHLTVDSEAMSAVEGVDVTHLVGAMASQEAEDAAFIDWRNTFPERHWSKTDLGACRLGWDAGRAALRSGPNPVLMACMVIDMQEEPQRAAFNAYRVAFRENAVDPNLQHAAALVRAWNGFADIMRIERV